MRILRITAAVLFAVIILTPLLTFNFEENAVSLIDNRELTKNPFSSASSGDLTVNIQSYVNDRIGLRDNMILAYTVLHDKLFNMMEHPTYIYGRDGYIFGRSVNTNHTYSEYHEAFADMIAMIQEYCENRNVPFLFVFTPAKYSVLTEYLPAGINYDRSWVDSFFEALDERGVRYLDNTKTLREKTDEGEAVFNQKYDANHWNDLGAFYGTNAILRELKKDIPAIHINDPDELTISETLKTSLPVSEFPIHEMVPEITVTSQANSDETDVYKSELELHPSYTSFGYYRNEERMSEGAPRALVFQGSYLNNFGQKYFANAFGEYIHVHDYQNITDFAYYFNIFEPECVIFEVAEYTFSEGYFSYNKMTAMDLNPVLADLLAGDITRETRVSDSADLVIERGNTLTKLRWICDEPFDYAWLTLDREYDMKKADGAYEVTVLTDTYEQYRDEIKTAALHGGTVIIYTFNK